MGSLTKYEMAETGILHLRDAADELMYADDVNGQPDLTRPMRIHLYGPGSKEYAKAVAEQQNRILEMLKRKTRAERTEEEQAREQTKFLVACTQAFENIDSDSGATGEALLIEIYGNRRLAFIPDQIAAFLKQTANFTKGSTTG